MTGGRSSIDARLRFAIAGKRQLRVRYTQKSRLVEPHDYGVYRGTTRVFVFQVCRLDTDGATTESGWRLLDVDKLEACVVLDTTFPGSRGHEHRRHLDWDVVYARVEH